MKYNRCEFKMVLEVEIAELKNTMREFSQTLDVLRLNIQSLTDLTGLLLQGAIAELMDGVVIGEEAAGMPVMWTPGTGPN